MLFLGVLADSLDNRFASRCIEPSTLLPLFFLPKGRAVCMIKVKRPLGILWMKAEVLRLSPRLRFNAKGDVVGKDQIE